MMSLTLRALHEHAYDVLGRPGLTAADVEAVCKRLGIGPWIFDDPDPRATARELIGRRLIRPRRRSS